MCARICALGERKWTSMSASEEMVREQLFLRKQFFLRGRVVVRRGQQLNPVPGIPRHRKPGIRHMLFAFSR